MLCQDGERTPLVPLQVCAEWAEIVNCRAHPRILLPQNRCLPHLLAAPFPRQPEPRCNTLDFVTKVVCHEPAAVAFGFFRLSRCLPASGNSRCGRQLVHMIELSFALITKTFWLPQQSGFRAEDI